jgi:hypothetical protein
MRSGKTTTETRGAVRPRKKHDSNRRLTGSHGLAWFLALVRRRVPQRGNEVGMKVYRCTRREGTYAWVYVRVTSADRRGSVRKQTKRMDAWRHACPQQAHPYFHILFIKELKIQKAGRRIISPTLCKFADGNAGGSLRAECTWASFTRCQFTWMQNYAMAGIYHFIFYGWAREDRSPVRWV